MKTCTICSTPHPVPDEEDHARRIRYARRDRLLRAMEILGRNLATAGALCEAFNAGFLLLGGRDTASTWKPNVKGIAWRT